MNLRNRKRMNEDYINPDGAPPETPGMALSKTSLDAQVTAYLQRYEEDSVGLVESMVHSMFSRTALSEGFKALFEQEEKPAQDTEDAGDDFDKIVSDIEGGDEALGVLPVKPEINLETFATKVHGLITSIENKLEFRNPVINMAVSYVQEQYGDEISNQLIEKFKEMGYKIKVDSSLAAQDTKSKEAE